MRKAQKRQVEETIRQMEEAHVELKRCIEMGIAAQAEELLADCQDAAVAIGTLIEDTEGEGHLAVTVLEEYCELVYQTHENLAADGINANKIYKILRQKLIKAENSIRNDIKIRTEVVFLPYKASMWDSLESVWKAADADPNCDAYVIPIPYFDKRVTDTVLGMDVLQKIIFTVNSYDKRIYFCKDSVDYKQNFELNAK